MATTSPDNIWTPDSGDNYDYVIDSAATAASIQNALTSRANSYIGTTSQREAFTATAPEGTLWSDTNGEKILWIKQGASWQRVWSGPERGRVFEWLNTFAATYGETERWFTELSQTLTLPAGLYQFTIGKRHRASGEAGAKIELLQGSTVKYRFEWVSQYHENGIKNDWASTTMPVVAGQYTVRVQTVHWQPGFTTETGLCLINGVEYSRVATIDML